MTKTALLFAGQGLEYVGMGKSLIGMGKSLCSSYLEAKRTFQEAGDILSKDFLKIIDNIEELKKQDNYQSVMLTACVASYRIFKEKIQVTPVCCAGHSSGEITALTCAGALRFEDALRLVNWSSHYLPGVVKKGTGAMALIAGIDSDTVTKMCKEISWDDNLVTVSSYNSWDQTIISGHQDAVEKAGIELKKKKAIVISLKLDTPFHSPLMKGAVEDFRKQLSNCIINSPHFPVISNVTAMPYEGVENIIETLLQQITSPILWSKSNEYMRNLGVTTTIEMGPQTGLRNLMKKNVPEIASYSFDHEEDIIKIHEVLLKPYIQINKQELEKNMEFKKEVCATASDSQVIGKFFSQNEEYNFENSELLQRVIGIWKNALNTNDVDIMKSLYDQGGDSMSAVNIVDQLNMEFNGRVDISDIYSYPTILEMTSYINSLMSNKHGLEAYKDDKRCNYEDGLDDKNDDIAVIGMACKFPGAKNYQEFWDNIKNGVDCINEIPAIRTEDGRTHFINQDRGLMGEKYIPCGLIDGIDQFDAYFFRISPKEAENMNPMQRVLLETAYEAFEDAGYGGKKICGTKTAVFAGVDNTKPLEYNKEFSAGSLTGSWTGILASRISYIFDLKGPALVIDTTCSSGASAVHMAIRSIRQNECEMAVAGGICLVSSTRKKETIIDMVESKQGKIRAFDKDADGTVWSEGVGVVLLKPLSRALKDRDHIHAVIKGSAMNNDGSSNGISAPNAKAQEQAIINAWIDASIDPKTITYIEAHGTGTIVGDPIEIKGITNAFRKYTLENGFCRIGSVKTNIGHTIAASGIASLIKVIMALKNKKYPPSLNYKNPNTYIDFKNTPVVVNDSLINWEYNGIARRAGINSFGFSGTNCHIIVEEYEDTKILENEEKERGYQVFTISAADEECLKSFIQKYIEYFEKCSSTSLRDICFTANTGRRHYKLRAAIIGQSISDILEKLYKLKSNLSENSDDIFYFHNNMEQKEDLSKKQYKFIDGFEENKNLSLKDLKDLCKFYIYGGEIDWERLYDLNLVKRTSLPVYPLKRKRHWLDKSLNEYKTFTSIISNTESVKDNRKDISIELVEEVPFNMLGKDVEKSLEDVNNEILSRVKDAIYNASGIEASHININEHFLEMGLDSIMLSDVRNQVIDEFGVDVSMRQFFESVNTPAALALHIDVNSTVKKSTTQINKELAKEEKEKISIDVPFSDESVEKAVVSSMDTILELETRGVEAIINYQLKVMTKQLELLGAAKGNKFEVSSIKKHEKYENTSHKHDGNNSSKFRDTTKSIYTVNNCCNSNGSDKPTAGEKPFVPYQPLVLDNDSRYNGEQKNYLEKFINKYCDRTKNSKNIAKDARLIHANSRNILGFRAYWKELVYPIIAKRSEGCYLWDADDNKYVDFTMGFGVNMFGHNPPFIIDVLKEKLVDKMPPLGPLNNTANEGAKLISELTGVERVAFYNSGTEAVMVALRIARAATRRSKIAIFKGSYHGTFDGVLVCADDYGESVPMAPGIIQNMAEDVLVLGYGSPASLETIRTRAHELAAVLVEPVQSRRPDLQPKEFLKELRKITENSGTALIFDEIVTGFRIHPGGAKAWYGVDCDIVTYGKVIGGGLPIGVVGGKASFMDAIDGGSWGYNDSSTPYNADKRTFVGGTFCTHPLAMNALVVLLNRLKSEGPKLQENLNNMSDQLATRLNDFFKENSVPIQVVNCGSVIRFVSLGDIELFYYHMIYNGVYIWEGRNCFLSTEHEKEDIDFIEDAVKKSIEDMKRGGFFKEY